MLHLLLGRDWTANRDEILNRIAADVHDCLPGRVLIVPELISHDMERRLCAAAGDTSSRFAEVLSFTRLARRVFDSMGSAAQECLDNGGRLVAMAAAARQLRSRLKAYASVETKPEFLTELIDGIDEFKRCCISSEDLRSAANNTEGSLAQKLEELSLLMESYDAVCSRGKRDPRDQMTWLLEYLQEGNFAQEHVFYIDGFPDFTRQNFAIIEYLIQFSPNVTISLNCDKADSDLLAFEKAGMTASEIIRCARHAGIEVKLEIIPEKKTPMLIVREKLFQGALPKSSACNQLYVFQGDTPWQECLGAAQEIKSLIENGCRYRDITIVCSDMSKYLPLANIVFHRFHIPLYQSGTEDILQKSVMNTVLTALDAALSNFDQKETLRYLRSALSPIQTDVCDLVENYAILWGIRGMRWTSDWEYHPDGLGGVWSEESYSLLNLLNDARMRAILPLDKMRKRFFAAVNLKEQVTALYGFLEDIQLAERLIQLAAQLDEDGDNRNAQILNQLWEILISALEQMYDVLGDTHWEPEHFSRLLRLLLSQYDVGTIPPVLDAVQIGSIDAMRCHQEKHLIVLGVQEGSLPGYSGSAGVLTDQERVALREMGVPLTGGAMEGIQSEFAEIYGVFCGAMESIRVYCSSEQPSFIYRRLRELSGEELKIDDSLGFAQADSTEAGIWLSGRKAKDAAKRLGLNSEYELSMEKKNYSMGKIQRENINALYGKTLNLSASQIDRQAECRLSYFLKYGLRAQERKEITVDPAEFGTYVHAVLENTARCIQDMGGFHKVTLQETLEIAHRFSESYAAERFSQITSERMTYLFQRNARELDLVVQELWNELSRSLFEPKEFEVNFGSYDGLAAIAIPNSEMNAILRGFVDRVDTWNQNGCTYFRVVDYKTGKKDFDYCDVFNGVGLQMLLYMFALKHSGTDLLGNNPVAAGVQYFPARVPYISTDGRMEESETELLRENQWKRKGLLLYDEEVLKAMEPDESYNRLSWKRKKDGTLTGDLAERDQLKLLEKYIFSYLAGMVEDIASGNIEANPYTRGSSHNACTYCPYGSICHKDTVENRRNYKIMSAQRFWEEVEKEMNHRGR